MHQGLADPASLPVRPHGERTKPQRRAAVDGSSGAHHVPDHLAARRLGNQGQGGQPAIIGSKPVEQRDLHRDPFEGFGTVQPDAAIRRVAAVRRARGRLVERGDRRDLGLQDSILEQTPVDETATEF